MILRMILLFHLLILGLANGGKVEAQNPAQPCKSTVSGTLPMTTRGGLLKREDRYPRDSRSGASISSYFCAKSKKSRPRSF
jgi:hypothetical protein